MKTRRTHPWIVEIVFLSGIISCGSAAAAQIQIEFSGEFATCSEFSLSCALDNPLRNLINTSFSGVIRFPDTGVDLLPDDDEKGRYMFAAPAYMSVTTAIPEFNLEEFGPIVLFVSNCIGNACAFNEDVFSVFATKGDYLYNFSSGAIRPPLETDELPSEARLRDGSFPSFSIISSDFEHHINIDIVNNRTISPLNVSISSIPIPPMAVAFCSAVGLLMRTKLRRE